MQLSRALETSYVLSSASLKDASSLLHALTVIRSLLDVQLEPSEEEMLKRCLWYHLAFVAFYLNLTLNHELFLYL